MSVTSSSRARLGYGTPRAFVLRDTCQPGRQVRRALLPLLALVVACARSGLDPGGLDPVFDAPDPGVQADPTAAPTATIPPATAGAPAMMPTVMPTSTAEPPSSTEPSTPSDGPRCVPSPEVCNGRDDDCNGEVDDLPGIECAGGGFQYCVAGTLSSCPRSCEVCIPGSLRICQNSYCTFWGEQECTADGQGFGPCRESRPPPSCSDVASKHKNSAELEQCCLDDGYCCLDVHDLDGDGDHHDMIGACVGVSCP